MNNRLAPWRKARTILSVYVAQSTAYRAELLIWMLSGTLSFVMMALWIAQARSAPGGQIGGFSPADFASYFVGTWVTTQLLVVWVVYELDFQIRLGHLSPKLLRPLDPIWEHLSSHLADKLIRLPFLVLIAAGVLWLVPGAHFTGDPLVYLAYAALALLGFALRFLIEYCIGLLGFWTESTTSFQDLLWLAYAALGGIFAPLPLYPEAVQRVAAWTPFPYMIGLPAGMLAGTASWAQVGHGFLVLMFWALGFFSLRLALWRLGLRRYGAVGA